METYIVYFSNEIEMVSFRMPELESVCELFGVNIEYDKNQRFIDSKEQDSTPFIFVKFPSEESIKKICTRSILIRSIHRWWGSSTSYDTLHDDIMNTVSKEEFTNVTKGQSFKFEVCSYGRKNTHEQLLKKIEILKELEMWKSNKVDLKNPELTFSILEDFGPHANKQSPPKVIHFGRLVDNGSRHIVDQFALPKRVYLGTTSMPSDLSLLMANQALVSESSFIIDPFVGTGSLLIACAHFGAMTIGSDIDMRVLKGIDKKYNVQSNFEQYQLEKNFAGLVRTDQSKPCLKEIPIFDAVVCDPPYGVRAGAKRVGKSKRRLEREEIQKKNPKPKLEHPPDSTEVKLSSMIPYSVEEVLRDLFDFSARRVKLGGRLVYFLPTTNDYDASDLPQHPCFQQISNSEQILSSKISRRLITLVKVTEFDPKIHNNLSKDELGQKNPAHRDFALKYFNDDNRKDGRQGKSDNKQE